jgi:hypothetical protein
VLCYTVGICSQPFFPGRIRSSKLTERRFMLKFSAKDICWIIVKKSAVGI